ncbi:Fanconi anemia [Nesidiocoris tenuis]|uniref:Fanconi anemia n=1 Tax=Nesidiocoris tenuis TaxID=355587 RepID=A0ABN7AP35_9HEMI|nr:Fanconi anemia [Nesidiocoris tenuis]
MYKRKKTFPLASSTLLSTGPPGSQAGPSSSTALSQTSAAGNSSSSSPSADRPSPLRAKSTSSESSLFTTEGTEGFVPPSFEKENLPIPHEHVRPTVAPAATGRRSVQEVLDMLTSPQSSQGSPGRSPNKRRRLDMPPSRLGLNYMEDVLYKAGFDFGRENEPNVLRKDQSVFVIEVAKILKEGSLTRNVEEFMRLLSKRLDEKTHFKAALTKTKTDSGLDVSHGDTQESLLRLLLTVDAIQPHLMNLLLDKMAEYIVPDSDSSDADERFMWVRVILRTMTYLNHIVNPSKIIKTLFDVIHSAPDVMIQTEIVTSIPDVTCDDQRDDVAQELINLMKAEPKLAPAVISALENIGLSGEVLYQVQISLIKSLRTAPPDQIPAFVKFIIRQADGAHVDEIINGLRSELVICQASDSSSSQIAAVKKVDVSSILILVFEMIRDAILMSRGLAKSWLKNIGRLKPNKKQRPMDIAMLLIIYACPDQSKMKLVEAVFKSKIKEGTFKEDLIDETVEALSEILKAHFSELLKLLSLLLNSPDIRVSKFAAHFLLMCFSKLDSLHCRMIILQLLENFRLNSKHMKNVLDLLHDLTVKFPSKVANYVTLIMLLLDPLPDLKVIEARQLMDIICSIAWAEETDMSSLQDEIAMMVQKQLRCPDSKVFRIGVVSTLMVIKHLTCVNENDANDTPISDAGQDSIILSSRSEKAFSFLEMILQASGSNPEIHVLAYDQLAYVIMNSENMDKSFMKKVSQVMQGTLQNYYIIATSDFSKKNDDLDEKLQFCLDTDLDDPVVLNLCDVVVNEIRRTHSFQEHRTVALPALFRAIRTLELADLAEIDALLGCAISLPCPSIYAKFASQDVFVQKVALDCLFHTCNWFREAINSFVYLVKDGSPEKIIMRLRAIVHLQRLIARCLPQVANYSPPSCNVDPSSGLCEKTKKITHVRKKGKKKVDKDKTTAENDNEDDAADEPSIVESDAEDEPLVAVEFSTFRGCLRELDFDVCLVLTLPLILTPEPPKDGNFSPQFGPSELLMMLEDLSAKLKYCLGAKKRIGFQKTLTVGFDNLSSTSLEIIVKNTAKLIGHLCTHLNKIVEYLHNLITVHDSCYDAAGMFVSGSSEIKQCAAMTFDVLDTFFSWSGLKSDVYIKFLLRALMKVAAKPIEKNQSISVNYAVQQAIEYLKTISRCVLDITSAVNLTNLIQTLAALQEDGEDDFVEIDTVSVCERFLRRRWYDFKGGEEKGPGVNQQLAKLLESYYTQSGLSAISSSLTTLSEETKELGRNSNLASFPQFNRLNLNVFIKIACKSLAIVIKKEIEDKDVRGQLKVWEAAVSCLQSLVIVVKNEDGIANLRQFVKGCLPVLRLFQSSGMQACSVLFKLEVTTVSQTIKNLQVVTRYVQNVCNYSKVVKDRTLIQQLPSIRGVLEQILLSVKNIMLQNNCTDAFFMGSMRNKDHHGEVIPSQQDTEEDSETVHNDNENDVPDEEISAILDEDASPPRISDAR